jgi:hypothetical protein
LGKSKYQIKQEFLQRLELFYRNFGNEWTLKELSSSENHVKTLIPFLRELSHKKVIELLNDEGTKFRILSLPSEHKDLI